MKNNKLLFLELIIGMVMIIIGLALKIDYYSTLVFAGGCGLGCGALVQLIRSAYYKQPIHLAEYEKYTQEKHIRVVDERKQFLRAKAGHNTYMIMLFVLLILVIVLSIIRTEAWIIAMIGLLFIVQWLIYTLSYLFFEKKM